MSKTDFQNGFALGMATGNVNSNVDIVTEFTGTDVDYEEKQVYNANVVNEVLNGVVEMFENKQDLLQDGENIKTINGQSILGAGDISISGGSTEEEWEHICEISVNGDDKLTEIQQTFDIGYKKLLIVFPSDANNIATSGRVLVRCDGRLLGAIPAGQGAWKQLNVYCEIVGKYITGYIGASISNLVLPTDNTINFTSISSVRIHCEEPSATFNTKTIDIYGVRA